MPTGQWACFEWQFDGTSTALNAWVDGTPLGSSSPMGLPSMPFDQLMLGLRIVAPDSTSPSGFDAWVDDVAVANTRIGCQ